MALLVEPYIFTNFSKTLHLLHTFNYSLHAISSFQVWFQNRRSKCKRNREKHRISIPSVTSHMTALGNQMHSQPILRGFYKSAFQPVSKPFQCTHEPLSDKLSITPHSLCFSRGHAKADAHATSGNEITEKKSFVPMRPWEDKDTTTNVGKDVDTDKKYKTANQFLVSSSTECESQWDRQGATLHGAPLHQMPMVYNTSSLVHHPVPVHLSMNIVSPAALSLSLSSVYGQPAAWTSNFPNHGGVSIQEHNPVVIHIQSTYPYINLP